ncbi:MAG: winged helix-turn-helix domain-containing protein, partial [Pseudomonadota bacterium]
MNADNRQNGRQPNEPETAETATGPSTNDGQGIADSGMVSQAGTNEGEQNRFLIAGELILDLKDQRAFFGKDPISLPQKPFRLLKALMAEPQTLVSKSALFEVVWDGMAVGDAVLTTAMKELRQGLHDPARRPEWIETVHGQGYRFLKPVSRAETLPPATSSDGAVGEGSIAQGGTDAAHANADPNNAATSDASRSSYDEASSVADVEETKAADGLAPGSAASSGSKGGSGPVDRQDGPSIGLIAALLAAFAGVVFILFAQLGAPDAKNAPSAGVVGEDGARASQANQGSQPTGPGQTRGGLPPAKSIAVLPFDDMSISADQEYFSDGVAEEILNALVRAPGLQVAARTSSFAFKGQNVDLRGVGQQLNVATILEGSVRKQGERVRVTAQLIQAKDGYHLWSETYDGSLEDIFELQERIARSVADALAVILDVESGDRLAKR